MLVFRLLIKHPITWVIRRGCRGRKATKTEQVKYTEKERRRRGRACACSRVHHSVRSPVLGGLWSNGVTGEVGFDWLLLLSPRVGATEGASPGPHSDNRGAVANTMAECAEWLASNCWAVHYWCLGDVREREVSRHIVTCSRTVFVKDSLISISQ